MMKPFSRPASGGLLATPWLAVAILGASANSAGAQLCGCTGNILTLCTAGSSVQGCLASIFGVGAPNVLANSGFDLVVSNVPVQRTGTSFCSFITPWSPGSPSFKCVANPVQRMGNIPAGGTLGQCKGELRLDFNAWLCSNPANSNCVPPSQASPLTVGSFAPNVSDLHDMFGNVLEWCLGSFSTCSANAVTDPFTLGSSARLIHGGGWDELSNKCLFAFRYSNPSVSASNCIGFRVVLAPALVP